MKPMTHKSAPAVLVLAVLAALYGCSGSSKSATATAAAGATTTVVGAQGATASTVKATGGGTFCTKVATSVNNGVSRAAALAQSGSGPDAIKALFTQTRQEEQDAAKSAPSAIKGDLQTVFDASNSFFDALGAVNYDFTKVDPAALAKLNTPALQAATQNVTAYVKEHCGIDLGGPPTTSP
ncbi:MAG: hypothetical protein ACHQNA_13280 [Acidimicrobiales bacterium]